MLSGLLTELEDPIKISRVRSKFIDFDNEKLWFEVYCVMLKDEN
jgi:hypothetical protein